MLCRILWLHGDLRGGIFGRWLFQAVSCRCFKLLIYSIITQRWIVCLLRAQQGETWLQGRLVHDMHLPAFCCVKTGLEDTRPGIVSGRQHAWWILVGLAHQTARRDLTARSLGTWHASSSTLLCQDRTWRHTSRYSIRQTACMVHTCWGSSSNSKERLDCKVTWDMTCIFQHSAVSRQDLKTHVPV